MKLRNSSVDEIISEVQYVLVHRRERIARFHLWLALRVYTSSRALLLGVLRHWGRR